MEHINGTVKRSLCHRRRPLHGFTLIELLVVVGIIALLVSIMLPSLEKARKLAKQSVCLSNQHQLVLACLMYYNATDLMPQRWVENPDLYPRTPIHFQFWGAEMWGYSVSTGWGPAARGDLGCTWPYYQVEALGYCPDWESDPELIQGGVVWPGTSTFLSYAFNARTQIEFATLESDYTTPGGVVSGRALTPEQFVQPASVLYFMDSRSGYQGSYVIPPYWAYTYMFWPDTPSPSWWNTWYPSQRHLGNFNAAFMDGHAQTCEFDEYYDVGPVSESRSVRYWGIYK